MDPFSVLDIYVECEVTKNIISKSDLPYEKFEENDIWLNFVFSQSQALSIWP